MDRLSWCLQKCMHTVLFWYANTPFPPRLWLYGALSSGSRCKRERHSTFKALKAKKQCGSLWTNTSQNKWVLVDSKGRTRPPAAINDIWSQEYFPCLKKIRKSKVCGGRQYALPGYHWQSLRHWQQIFGLRLPSVTTTPPNSLKTD